MRLTSRELMGRPYEGLDDVGYSRAPLRSPISSRRFKTTFRHSTNLIFMIIKLLAMTTKLLSMTIDLHSMSIKLSFMSNDRLS